MRHESKRDYENKSDYTRTNGDSGIEKVRHYYQDHTGGHVSYSVSVRENGRWTEHYASLDYDAANKIAQTAYEKQTKKNK